MREQVMLSTVDNPYNPFKDYSEWFVYDVVNGYNSSAYLARIANTTDDMSEVEELDEIERAIDEILKYDFTGMYCKVHENDIIKPKRKLTENDFKKETEDT